MPLWAVQRIARQMHQAPLVQSGAEGPASECSRTGGKSTVYEPIRRAEHRPISHRRVVPAPPRYLARCASAQQGTEVPNPYSNAYAASIARPAIAGLVRISRE